MTQLRKFAFGRGKLEALQAQAQALDLAQGLGLKLHHDEAKFTVSTSRRIERTLWIAVDDRRGVG